MALVIAWPALRGDVPIPTELLASTPPWMDMPVPEGVSPELTRIDSLVQYAAWALPDLERLHRGELPLWNPRLFAGFPSYVGPGPYYPPFFPPSYLLARLAAPPIALTWQPIMLLWWTGFVMAVFLFREGLGQVPALAGAVAWMTATGIHVWFGLPIFLLSLWSIPALCLCGRVLVESPGPRSAGLLAATIGLLLTTGSMNPIIFAGVIAGAWTLTLLFATPSGKNSRSRVVLWGVGGTVLGLLTGALGWLPMVEALGYINRDVRFPWERLYKARAPVASLLTAAMPEYLGGTWSKARFGGGSIPELAYGSGIVAVIACCMAWRTSHRRLALFALCTLVIAQLGALGTPVGRLLSYLPGFGTSMLSRMYQCAEWGIAVLAAIGVANLMQRKPEQAGARLAVAGLVAGVCMAGALYVAPRMFAETTPAEELSAHYALFADWWVPLWLALGIIIVGGFVCRISRRTSVLVLGLLIALAVERGPHIAHLTPWRAQETLFPETPTTARLAAAGATARALNPSGLLNTLAPMGVSTASGYHPFVLRSYLSLLKMGIPGNSYDAYHYIEIPLGDFPVVHLLGVQRGVLRPGESPPAPFQPTAPLLASNPRAWPRAVIVPEAIAVASEAEAEALMHESVGAWRERAVVSGTLPVGARGGRGTATIRSYAPEHVRIDVDADKAAYLCLTDQWYPGWVATVDGKPADILRSFLALRLVPIPAGEHTVEFRFRPPVLRWATRLTVFGLAGIAICGLAGRRTRTSSDG